MLETLKRLEMIQAGAVKVHGACMSILTRTTRSPPLACMRLLRRFLSYPLNPLRELFTSFLSLLSLVALLLPSLLLLFSSVASGFLVA